MSQEKAVQVYAGKVQPIFGQTPGYEAQRGQDKDANLEAFRRVARVRRSSKGSTYVTKHSGKPAGRL